MESLAVKLKSAAVDIISAAEIMSTAADLSLTASDSIALQCICPQKDYLTILTSAHVQK